MKHNKQALIASSQSPNTGDAKANVVDEHISTPQKASDDIPLSAEEEQMVSNCSMKVSFRLPLFDYFLWVPTRFTAWLQGPGQLFNVKLLLVLCKLFKQCY